MTLWLKSWRQTYSLYFFLFEILTFSDVLDHWLHILTVIFKNKMSFFLVLLELQPMGLTLMRKRLRNCWKKRQLLWRSLEKMPPPTIPLRQPQPPKQKKLQISWICLESLLQLGEVHQHHPGKPQQQPQPHQQHLTKPVTICYNLLETLLQIC